MIKTYRKDQPDLFYDHTLIDQHRIKLGYTIKDFADQCGIGVSTMHRIVYGKYFVKGYSEKLKQILKYLETMSIPNAGDILKKPEDRESHNKKNKKLEVNMILLMPQILEHWGLAREPFHSGKVKEIYVNDRIREAKQLLIQSATSDYFLLFKGPVGAGKSSILMDAWREIQVIPDLKAVWFHPQSTDKMNKGYVYDMMIQKFGGMKPPGSYHEKDNLLAEIINNAGRSGIKLALILDQAHKLSPECLHTLKVVWEGFNVHDYGLAIILVGQQEIEGMLQNPGLSEVHKRLFRYTLDPFNLRAKNPKWIMQYINHWLKICGGKLDIFTEGAVRLIMKYIETPLDVNAFCRVALKTGADIKAQVIDEEVMAKALERQE